MGTGTNADAGIVVIRAPPYLPSSPYQKALMSLLHTHLRVHTHQTRRACAALALIARDAATEVSATQPGHRALLAALWRGSLAWAAVRVPGTADSEADADAADARAPLATSPQLPKDERWKAVGFQGDNPLSDFRGMGLLSLRAMVHICVHHPRLAVALVALQQPPAAALAVASRLPDGNSDDADESDGCVQLPVSALTAALYATSLPPAVTALRDSADASAAANVAATAASAAAAAAASASSLRRRATRADSLAARARAASPMSGNARPGFNGAREYPYATAVINVVAAIARMLPLAHFTPARTTGPTPAAAGAAAGTVPLSIPVGRRSSGPVTGTGAPPADVTVTAYLPASLPWLGGAPTAVGDGAGAAGAAEALEPVRAAARAALESGAVSDAVLDAASALPPPDCAQYPLFRLMCLPRAPVPVAAGAGEPRQDSGDVGDHGTPHVATAAAGAGVCELPLQPLTPSQIFFEVVTQAVALLDVVFTRVGAGYFTFQQVLAAVVTRVKYALARAPVSLEAFCDMIWADETPWLRRAGEVAACAIADPAREAAAARAADAAAAAAVAAHAAGGDGAAAREAAAELAAVLLTAPRPRDFSYYVEADGFAQAVAPRPYVLDRVVPTVFDLGDRFA
jgi:hypothetical protein